MVAASGGLPGVYNIKDLGFGDTKMFKHDPGPCGFHFHRVSIQLDGERFVRALLNEAHETDEASPP